VDLAERVAIVTGGGNGIGRHYAVALADAGAAVVIAEIDAAAAERVAAAIAAAGGRALAVPTDVSDEASVDAMVALALDAFGRVDVLVNNAAIDAAIPFRRAPAEALTVAEWDRLFAVNVRGVWLCCKAVVPPMRARGYGKIINISSGSAWNGAPYMLHYVTTKAAVAGLTRALAREVGRYGIRVNTVAPGLTESETLLPQLRAEVKQQAVAERAIPRAEQPEDLVGTVLFLASGASDFITGQTLHVDGGSVLS